MKNASVILGAIRLRQSGASYRTIEQRYRIGSNTAQTILSRYTEIGKPLEELLKMQPQEVERLFYPPENMARCAAEKPMPDWSKVYEQWKCGGRDATLFNLWRDYRKENPNGYEITQFRLYFHKYAKEHEGDGSVVMAVNRVPGEKMYIDWVGERPAVIQNPETEELTAAHFFVTAVGVSDEIYCEAFPDEKLPNFLTGVTHAVSFYGAVTKYFVPDNLKTAVTRNSRDDLILQTGFDDLQDFYGAIVTPTLPASPHGKPTVEESVLFIERRVLYEIKKHKYPSFGELNRAVRQLVNEINHENFEHKTYSRHDLFVKYDKPCMMPLPGKAFTVCDYKTVDHIPDYYHVEYDDHYYSVPYQMYNEPCIIKASASVVKICDIYNRVIYKHPRAYEMYPRYITAEEHMAPNHRYEKELGERTDKDYLRWAARFGPNTVQLIDAILKRPKYKEQSYRSCMGVLQMAKTIPVAEMEKIAGECIASNSCKYSTVRDLIKTYHARHKTDVQTPEGKKENSDAPEKKTCSGEQGTPEHGNIRGPHYYT